MKAKRIITILIVIVLLSVTFLGINSVNTIDSLAYVVSLGFDITDTGKLELSFQIAVPAGNSGGSSGSTSSQSSSSIISSVECNTIESGINLVNSYLGKKLNLSHCKAIVFSEEIATKGIGEYLYTLINNIEIRPTCNVIISKCNAKYFLNNSKPLLEPLSSKYYEIASTADKNTGFTANTTLQEFFSSFTDSLSESFAILGGINNSNDSESNRSIDNDSTYTASNTPVDSQTNIETMGIAVFKDDKLVGELNGEESIAQLMLMNDLKNATISIPSPFESTNYIDLYITKSKTKAKVYISNGTPFIKPTLKIEARIISMSDDYKYLNKENLVLIENYANNYIKSFINSYLYKTSKELKADVVGFGKYAISNFLTWDEWDKYNWLDNYQNAFFDVTVDVNVKSRYLIIDT